MTEPELIYHLALVDEWATAVVDGVYTRSTIGRSLAEEGYIHASTRDQVAATAARFYADRDDVVVLAVTVAALDAPVVVEDLFGTGESFPHVYGPIPVDAVAATTPLAAFLAG